MSPNKLSERDICSKFISPALQSAGWDMLNQVREEVYLTKGRIIVRGKLVTRGHTKFADYILYYRSIRITGDDNEGREQLDNFIDPEATYPVLVTTSRLLSTGVDVQTCRLIVAHASSVSPK